MRRRRKDQRGLTTLLFTDIVRSTEIAVELGDRRWRTLQGRHHDEVRRQLKRFGGREVDTAGDGFFATFESPAAGVRCASEILRRERKLGLEIRAGLHIGEAELDGEKVSGIAVTIAARVSAAAGPGQILATDTIVHLVSGSGLMFAELGSCELKGVPGRFDLFELAMVDDQPIGAPLDPQEARQDRDRATPSKAQRASPRWPLLLGAATAVVLVAALLYPRHRGSTVQRPSPDVSPATLTALNDEGGDVPFDVELSPAGTGGAAGPFLFTGRPGSFQAFTWLPWGVRGCCLKLAQVNSMSGAVVQGWNDDLFGTKWTTCICVASVRGRIWTAILLGTPTPAAATLQQPGVLVRGIDRRDRSQVDIVVDKALLPSDVTTVVSAAGYLWIGTSARGLVYRVDLDASRTKRFALRQSAEVLVFGDGSLWALDNVGDRITRIDVSTGDVGPSQPISGNVQRIAVGGGYVWGADASGNEIQRISEDLRSAATSIDVEDIGGSPTAIAYDSGSLLVGFASGTIAKIDPSNPDSPRVIWAHRIGNGPSEITVNHGIVWEAGAPASG